MKLINSGNLMDGIVIDMSHNTDEHFVVKVFGKRDDERRVITITTQLFNDAHSYETGDYIASAVHTLPYDTYNVDDFDGDNHSGNVIPVLFYKDKYDYSVIVLVEYSEPDDDDEPCTLVTVRTDDDDTMEWMDLISRNSYLFNFWWRHERPNKRRTNINN